MGSPKPILVTRASVTKAIKNRHKVSFHWKGKVVTAAEPYAVGIPSPGKGYTILVRWDGAWRTFPVSDLRLWVEEEDSFPGTLKGAAAKTLDWTSVTVVTAAP